jgi:hypothetical protein
VFEDGSFGSRRGRRNTVSLVNSQLADVVTVDFEHDPGTSITGAHGDLIPHCVGLEDLRCALSDSRRRTIQMKNM